MQYCGWNHKINIRICEIYNDNIIDLINDNVKKDEVIDTEITSGPDEVMRYLKKGFEKRKVAGTDCND